MINLKLKERLKCETLRKRCSVSVYKVYKVKILKNVSVKDFHC